MLDSLRRGLHLANIQKGSCHSDSDQVGVWDGDAMLKTKQDIDGAAEEGDVDNSDDLDALCAAGDVHDEGEKEKKKRPGVGVPFSAAIPEGARMRRYERAGKPTVWHGILPTGKCDVHGRRHRVRSWANTGRTETDVMCDIERWLWDNS